MRPRTAKPIIEVSVKPTTKVRWPSIADALALPTQSQRDLRRWAKTLMFRGGGRMSRLVPLRLWRGTDGGGLRR